MPSIRWTASAMVTLSKGTPRIATGGFAGRVTLVSAVFIRSLAVRLGMTMTQPDPAVRIEIDGARNPAEPQRAPRRSQVPDAGQAGANHRWSDGLASST